MFLYIFRTISSLPFCDSLQSYFIVRMQVFNTNHQSAYIDEALQSPVLRIQNLQIALQRAIENISLLQQNLSFVIEVKQELEAELRVREKREQALMKQFQKELTKKDAEIANLKSEREEIAELLTDTQESLNARQANAMQREEEKRRLERIIEDQRSTLQALEEQLLAAKYSSDLSYQSISFDNLKIQQMEKQSDLLRFDLGKARAALQKETAKVKKLQREVEGFKSWLGGVLGVRKVVEGCEGVLMQEIQSRLGNLPKF